MHAKPAWLQPSYFTYAALNHLLFFRTPRSSTSKGVSTALPRSTTFSSLAMEKSWIGLYKRYYTFFAFLTPFKGVHWAQRWGHQTSLPPSQYIPMWIDQCARVSVCTEGLVFLTVITFCPSNSNEINIEVATKCARKRPCYIGTISSTLQQMEPDLWYQHSK